MAHIISTTYGARKFAEDDDPPPAEWLCVFDPYRRYAKPGHIIDLGEQGPFIDPFDLYGLDSDAEPKKVNPNNLFEKREVPPTAWDGFEAKKLDRQNLKDDSFSAIRGHLATSIPSLPSRLSEIGRWIAKISDQPASIWWAANQFGLHPSIQNGIQWQLERSKKEVGPETRQAWRYLFEAWDERREDCQHDWYKLKAVIDRDGWNSATIRKFATINRPYVKVERNYWGGPIPPERKKNTRIQDMVLLNSTASRKEPSPSPHPSFYIQ